MNKGTQGFPSGAGLTLRALGDVQQNAAKVGPASNGLMPSWDAATGRFRLNRGPAFDVHRSLYNFDPKQLFNFRAAVAASRNGSGSPYIVVDGDSTSVATGVLGGATLNPAYLLGKMCDARGYIPFRHEVWRGNQGALNGLTYQQWDPRITTVGTGWTGGNTLLAQQSTTGTDLVITPTIAWDTVRLGSLVVTTSFGTTTVKAGVTTLGTTPSRTSGVSLSLDTFTTGSAPAVQTLTLTVATVGGSGRTDLSFVEVWDSTKPGLRVFNYARGGGTVGNQAPDPSFDPRPLLAPKLTLINLTINDSGESGSFTPVGDYKAGMQALIDQGKSTGDVMLVTGNWVNINGYTSTTYFPPALPYYKVLYDLAIKNNLPILDLRHRWQGYTAANNAGLMQDSLHPNGAGGQDIANLYYNVIS